VLRILAGKRFLVVEEEPLVALDMVAGLEQGGAESMGSFGNTLDALPSSKALVWTRRCWMPTWAEDLWMTLRPR
jgi:hypothetical protein